MGNILLLINSLLLFLISGIHFYWAFGGQWRINGVFPEIKNKPNLKPSILITFVVAIIFGIIGILILNRSTYLEIISLNPYENIIITGIAVIFGLRFIGDFKYIGISKTQKKSLFASNDTKFYSPLCLYICISLLLSNYFL